MVFHFTSPDYSASSSEDDDVGNVTGQQPQPCWTWPLSITSFYLQGVGRKSHIEIFNSLLSDWCWHEPQPSMPVGRTAQASTNIGRLDTRHKKHWPGHNNTKRLCCVCSALGVTWTGIFRCVKCDMAFCADQNCFADYHTQKQLIRHFSSVRLPCKQLKPRPQCK